MAEANSKHRHKSHHSKKHDAPTPLPDSAEGVLLASGAGTTPELVTPVNDEKKERTFARSKLATIMEELLERTEGKLEPVGGWRRGNRGMLKDLDFITTTSLKQIATMINLPDAPNIDSKRKRLSFTFRSVPIDVWNITPESMPFALLAFTGDKIFEKVIRKHAKKQGFKLNEYGLFNANGQPAPEMKNIKTEKDIFNAIGFEWREPFERVMENKKYKKKSSEDKPEPSNSEDKPKRSNRHKHSDKHAEKSESSSKAKSKSASKNE